MFLWIGGNEMGKQANKQTSVCWFHFNTDVSVAAGTDTIKQTGQQRVPDETIRGKNDQRYIYEHDEHFSIHKQQQLTTMLYSL